MGTNQFDIPSFEELQADPEIAALLAFEPVGRKRRVAGGWTPELQRRFNANIAAVGSRTRAAEALGREVAGASKLCRATGGESFSAACDAALELYERRGDAEAAQNRGRAWAEPSRSRGKHPHPGPLPLAGEGERGEGQVLNEYGEWEEADSYAARVEDARDSLSNKLRRCRRLYLMSIADQPAKRAAFEILTGWPVDWALAKAGAPQPDEPWRKPSPRNPDVLLAAEAGCFGPAVHGPDRVAELYAEINRWRAQQGLEPIDEDEA